MKKPELQEKLTEILEGAQRVPSLLVLSPMQTLTELNLSQYEVLDCEPLHDMKGHLLNILPEIPPLLSEPLRSECQQILDTTFTHNKVSGALLRVAAIKLHLKLIRSDAHKQVKLLAETAIRISEILYMSDAKRCPKTVLRLYNLTWLNHELCKELLQSPKTQSVSHVFGIYLHALAVHAPVQHQIMSLLSVNAESQERLFSQIKRISLRATNRKTDNVLPTILLCIQARQKMDDYKPLATKQEGTVTSASHKVEPYQGTEIEKSFINSRLQSWQAHLERTSTFLQHGENTWWEETSESYKFFDSDTDASYRPEGPVLMHFRSSTLPEVQVNSHKAWQHIVDNKIPLPTSSIRVYDTQGEYVGTRVLTTTTKNNQFSELTEQEYQEPITQNSTCEVTPALDVHTITPPEEVLVTVQFNDRATEEDKDSTEKPFSTLVTKAAMAIERVTGHSQILTELDFLRNKVKSYKYTKSTRKVPSQDEKEEYGILLAKLRTIVNTNINDLKREIKTYEKDYYHTHNAFPNDSTAYKQLCKKLHRGKILVSRWADFTL